MEKNNVKFFDVIVIGRMNNMGSAKCLYCVVKYNDIVSLKVEAGESVPVNYVSSYYNYNIGDTLLYVVDGEKASLYNKKGGKKVNAK